MDKTGKIKAAVIGVGYLGRFHAQKYAQMEDVDLVAVVDTSEETAARVAEETGTPYYTDTDEILNRIEAASVVVPTTHHYEIASLLLSRGIHVMLEKPITTTVEQADALIEMADATGAVLQVGHLEQFNPAVITLIDQVTTPLFIEAHRLSSFKPRSIDVDVVLDLMIHDIEIVLSMVDSPVKEIRASGMPVLTPNVDIANVRLIFENGCTANLTASRISLNNMRRIRVFQPGSYISADCTEKSNLFVTGDTTEPGAAMSIVPEVTTHDNTDILFDELKAFIRAVRGKEVPKVSGVEGRNALALALDINRAIEKGLSGAEILKQNDPVSAHVTEAP